MTNEPRKATDILLELEAKVDMLLNYIKSQDLNIKILSNKLNSLMEKGAQSPVPTSPYTVEAVAQNHFQPQPQLEDDKQIPISSEFQLPMEPNPKGFRRTSRPETFSGDNAMLPKPPPITHAPVKAEVTVPQMAIQPKVEPVVQPPQPTQPMPPPTGNSIPVVQRIVDKNGKSVFLADVEIYNSANMESVAKVRTSGNGKWSAPLSVGKYRVVIRKRESLTKEKIEITQDITVDGTQSLLELPMMIIK